MNKIIDQPTVATVAKTDKKVKNNRTSWLLGGAVVGAVGYVCHLIVTKPVSPNEFDFDVSKKGNSLKVQFTVTEYRNYFLTLRFKHQGEEDTKRVRDIVGDGAFKIFTQASVDKGKPELVYLNTEEDMKRYDQCIASGEYVVLPTDKDAEIKLHISVLDDKENEIINESINSIGYFAHGFNFGQGGYFERMLKEIALKPGKYRVEVQLEEEQEKLQKFSDIQTKLAISFHQNELPLKPNNEPDSAVANSMKNEVFNHA